jgi:acetyl-CoA carboxylase biotin carboxyl carrier protein
MAEKTLIAKVQEEDGTILVTSPVVAMADGSPKVGAFLNPLGRVITMKILNQRYMLRLPRGTQGRVTEVFIPNAYTPVAYGQPIARIDPRALEAGAGGSGEGEEHTASGKADADLVAVPAPSDGIFYRRPSPDSAPYVEVGSRVSPGSLLGLVEVMKCFYQITYDETGVAEEGEIVEILAEDASEVRFGQPLFRIRPLT